MNHEDAATILWGTERERAERWERFPIARQSAILANIAKMHIRGDISYLTSLLLAIGALSLRAIGHGKHDFNTIPGEEWIARMIGTPDGIDHLEAAVDRLARFDELTMRELGERARMLGTRQVMKIASAEYPAELFKERP